jgi:1-acyl-sn-glycerol-3-phosphate acyltransferase
MFPGLPDEVRERIHQIDVPFNTYGLDRFGISRDTLAWFYGFLTPFYRHYFQIQTAGIEHVPKAGRAMIIGNHSGGIPVDASMVMTSLFLDMDPPRHTHGMVEKFAQKWPIVSQIFSRMGQLAGLPEHAVQLLESERILLVFPEGARGTGKLYQDRYRLVRFGTGFMRLALKTRTPIVPFAFVGGEEALPTIAHSRILAQLTGAPYWPIPPWVIPWPMPVPCRIHYGEPMTFEGDGNESDEDIEARVVEVRERITELMREGLEALELPIPEHLGMDLEERA